MSQSPDEKLSQIPDSGSLLAGRSFVGGSWQGKVVANVTFEECRFREVDIEKAEFLDCTFLECRFRQVRMNLANLKGTGFQDVLFENSRLRGIDWQATARGLGFLGVSFDNCSMEYGSFAGMKIEGTHLRDCRLQECDFSETQARGVGFPGCDLERARFHDTDLRKADFTDALNYSLDPSQNKVQGARFALSGVMGLLHEFGLEIV